MGIIVIDRGTYGDRTYLSNWSRWRPADRGDHGAGVFIIFGMCCVVCVLLSRRRERRQKRERRVSGESREIKILGCWSLGLQLTNRNEGLSTKKNA
jgi:hypothetical protein